VPARLEVPSFTHGYHEVFQSQLPVYITADSIFHATFASHDARADCRRGLAAQRVRRPSRRARGRRVGREGDGRERVDDGHTVWPAAVGRLHTVRPSRPLHERGVLAAPRV